MMQNFAQTWIVSVPPKNSIRLASRNDGKEQPEELTRSPEVTPLKFRCVNLCVKIFPKSAKID